MEAYGLQSIVAFGYLDWQEVEINNGRAMNKQMEDSKIPTLYGWAGGVEVIEVRIIKFYDKVVLDDILSPIFQHMSHAHQVNVAHFISEVFGGPNLYTKIGGSLFGMVKQHFQKIITEEQRKMWVELLLRTADEIQLPDEPEFRSAFVGYLEWGTGLAVLNSNMNELTIDQSEPMPEWGWGEVGGPYQE